MPNAYPKILDQETVHGIQWCSETVYRKGACYWQRSHTSTLTIELKYEDLSCYPWFIHLVNCLFLKILVSLIGPLGFKLPTWAGFPRFPPVASKPGSPAQHRVDVLHVDPAWLWRCRLPIWRLTNGNGKGVNHIDDIWVCLKMVSTPKPNGFADHYPYEKWLFHWEY